MNQTDQHKIFFDLKIIFQEPSFTTIHDSSHQDGSQIIKFDLTEKKAVDPLKDQKIQLIESFSIVDCLNWKILGRRKPIIFQKLLSKLEREANLFFIKTKISIYLSKCKMYMNCGNYPLNENVLIRPENYYGDGVITILAKMRGEIKLTPQINQNLKSEILEKKISELSHKGMSLFHFFALSEVKEQYSNEREYGAQVQKMREILDRKETNKKEHGRNRKETNLIQEDDGKEQEGRRLKERRIGYVINKVVAWTKWTGRFRHKWLQVNRKEIQKYPPQLSLEYAAEVVGIPKKTLDDYLFHIQNGNKFKFNFNEHCMDRFAVLRMFVYKWNRECKRNGMAIENMATKKMEVVKKLSKKQRKLLEKQREKRETDQIDEYFNIESEDNDEE